MESDNYADPGDFLVVESEMEMKMYFVLLVQCPSLLTDGNQIYSVYSTRIESDQYNCAGTLL